MKMTAAPPPRTAVVSSSPGRTEKLPAPPGLARLLREKSGSRSRGRSSAARSSPMFLSKSRSVGPPSSTAATAAADGEPSSPKVTCIGQVRIRGKNPSLASGSKKSKPDKQAATRCRCIERAFLCKIFSVRKSAPPGRPHRRPLWRRWALGSIRSGSYKQQKAFEKGEAELITYPVASATARVSVPDLEDGDETEEEAEEETRVFMPAAAAAATPPKNALLLMRCRSAPHNRSSALATARFAVSPVPLVVSPETPTAEPCIVVSSGDGEAAAAAEGPVVLTRSKSEPASTAAEKLVVPEAAAFWKSSSGSSRRRLELVEEEERGPQPPALIHTS